MPYKDKKKIHAYNHEYHIRTWQKRKVNQLVLKRIRKKKLAEWLSLYKLNLKCNICDEKHPACLDFHHSNSKEKDGTVANMITEGYSIKTIKKEIEKCIVLCKNCHAKKHYEINNKLKMRSNEI